jgi:hypothetical protein
MMYCMFKKAIVKALKSSSICVLVTFGLSTLLIQWKQAMWETGMTVTSQVSLPPIRVQVVVETQLYLIGFSCLHFLRLLV